MDVDEDEKKSVDKPRKFTPPPLDDVKSYCQDRKNKVDAARFVDYYTANGWRIGKTTMKDWRAAVRVWERNEPKQEQLTNRYDQIKKLMEETTDEKAARIGCEKCTLYIYDIFSGGTERTVKEKMAEKWNRRANT